MRFRSAQGVVDLSRESIDTMCSRLCRPENTLHPVYGSGALAQASSARLHVVPCDVGAGGGPRAGSPEQREDRAEAVAEAAHGAATVAADMLPQVRGVVEVAHRVPARSISTQGCIGAKIFFHSIVTSLWAPNNGAYSTN